VGSGGSSVRQFEAGLRHQEIGPTEIGSDPELVTRIQDEIRTRGPIPFARYMEMALYEPALGYYRRAVAGPGRAGDFLTAPETHPVFGRAIARQLDELWRVLGSPPRFVVREHGAGDGALAVAILDGLAAERSPLLPAVRYQAVEIEPDRLATLRTRVVEAGHGVRLDESPTGTVEGVILANELLDALPVHRVVQRGAELRELMVTFERDQFADVEREPTTPALARRLAVENVSLGDGQVAEICLALDAWLAHAASELGRGMLLLIDYGYPATELYGPRHLAGTLLAYVGHRAHDDPFLNVGRQDLTAHVDVTAVEAAAARAGLRTVGVTTQAEFLVGLGLGDLLAEAQADPSATLESYLELRSSVGRLIDPAATGAFRVMAFGRGLPADVRLRGFAFRLRRPRGSRSSSGSGAGSGSGSAGI
jgi:SAM-dependent MidA family methyltransferase